MAGELSDRTQRFLDLYKQLEELLEEKYKGNGKRRSSSPVMEYLRDEESLPVREKLDLCREIRNLLTHNANLDGLPVVEPSPAVVESLEEILTALRRPPLALAYAAKGDQILKARPDQRILRLMETMDKNGYSHVPVLEGSIFRGVFSADVLFRWQLQNKGQSFHQDTRLGELSAYYSLKANQEHYAFLGENTSYFEAQRVFERVRGKNRRVAAIFLTRTGDPAERLLGMLTPWDVLGKN